MGGLHQSALLNIKHVGYSALYICTHLMAIYSQRSDVIFHAGYLVIRRLCRLCLHSAQSAIVTDTPRHLATTLARLCGVVPSMADDVSNTR